jgi:hypothetical protein
VQGYRTEVSVTHLRAGVLTPFDQRFTVILPRCLGRTERAGHAADRDWEWEQSAATARQPTRAQLAVEGSYEAETAVISRCSRCACVNDVNRSGCRRAVGEW